MALAGQPRGNAAGGDSAYGKTRGFSLLRRGSPTSLDLTN
jgi:hypothetical protein